METNEVVVETPNGRLKGLRELNVCAFRSIPYARPPTGALRFMAPVPCDRWTGVRDAFSYGMHSVHTSADIEIMGTKEVMGLLFEPPEWAGTSEDCLYLHVWTPEPREGKRPVLVWCHPGGFFAGAAASRQCDGSRLSVDNDVVVVSINHRLGVLGFLYLADIGGPAYGASGNAGMLDIVTALTWIRENISHFGGDPQNVTIFGESGGGAKVATLLAMPSAQGLFHKAIIQSGPWPRFLTRSAASEIAEMVLAELGLNRKSLSSLHTTSVQQISASQTTVMRRLMGRPFSRECSIIEKGFGPVLDEGSIPYQPSDPAALALSTAVPLLIGSNKDEGTFFVTHDHGLPTLDNEGLRLRIGTIAGEETEPLITAYQSSLADASPGNIFVAFLSDFLIRGESIALAERKALQESAPVFMYQFAYETSAAGGGLKASHGVEIPFVFNTVSLDPYAGRASTRFALARQISGAWAWFARCGHPEYEGLPFWPRYTLPERATMVLNVASTLIFDPDPELRAVWGRIRNNSKRCGNAEAIMDH